MSAHQLHRMLWRDLQNRVVHAHRIRYAMAMNLPMMSGTVEVDETYIGGKERGITGA